MRMGRYILDGKMPVRCDDLHMWAIWFDTANRHVALTQINEDVKVSTVFLGNDHNWDDGPPILFETMIFGGPHDEFQERYCTWAEAEAGHARAVALARSGALK